MTVLPFAPSGPAPELSRLADLAAELTACLQGLAAGPGDLAPPRAVQLKPVPDRARAAVLVVDDRPLLAQGIRRVLESTADLRLAGCSASLRAAVEDVRALEPDVVLLNPRTGGEPAAPELCRRARLECPQVKVLVLAGPADDALLTACQNIGVHGVVAVGCTEAELVDALRAALAAPDPRPAARPVVVPPVHEHLRPREYDVLRLLADGAATADVAARLGLTTNTVRSYTQSLMAKLQAHNRVQLLLVARRLGLL